jgi:hypothetical protein
MSQDYKEKFNMNDVVIWQENSKKKSSFWINYTAVTLTDHTSLLTKQKLLAAFPNGQTSQKFLP